MKSTTLTLLLLLISIINMINAMPVLNESIDDEKPIRVNNYSYSYNMPSVNKYIFFSLVLGLVCLFLIGLTALMTVEVQNNNSYSKQFSKQFSKQMLYNMS